MNFGGVRLEAYHSCRLIHPVYNSGYTMMSPTPITAGAGKINGAWRWAARANRAPKPIGQLLFRLVQQLLELLVRLRDDHVGLGAFDRLLDGHADDVPVLGDIHDLR